MSNTCNYSTGVSVEVLQPPLCTLELWITVVETIYLFGAVILSTAGNFFVLSMVAKYKELRYRSVIVSLSVVVIDLLLVPTFLVPALVAIAARKWLFQQVGCTIIGLAGTYLILVRWLAMATISLDRFCYIFFPLSYNRWCKIFLGILTFIAWALPVALVMPSVSGFGGYAFDPGSMSCFVECNNDTNCAYYYLWMFGMQVLLGACLPAVLYLIMLCFSFYVRRRTTIRTLVLRSINTIGLPASSAPLPITSKWSSRDMKAIITFLLVFVTQVVTTLPIYGSAILRRVSVDLYVDLPLWAHILVFNIFMAAPYLDPLVVMRNQDFKKAMKKTCSCQRRMASARRRPSMIPGNVSSTSSSTS